MSKVPPKIQRSVVRPRRPLEAKGKKPGPSEEGDEDSMQTGGSGVTESMSEKLTREREAGHDLKEYVGAEEAREEAQRHEEKSGKSSESQESKLAGGRSGEKQDENKPSKLAMSAFMPGADRANQAPGARVQTKLADGFESGKSGAAASGSTAQASATKSASASGAAAPTGLAAPPPPAPRLGGGGFGAAMKFLNDAKEPGFYFQVRPDDAPASDDDADFAAAVEAARAELAELRGVESIEPGLDHEGTRVVLVNVGRGFCESSMAAIPEAYGKFATLLGLPYELLPLRRI